MTVVMLSSNDVRSSLHRQLLVKYHKTFQISDLHKVNWKPGRYTLRRCREPHSTEIWYPSRRFLFLLPQVKIVLMNQAIRRILRVKRDGLLDM